MDINAIASLANFISYPYLIYHRDFVKDFGPKLVQSLINCLNNAPEKSMRDVRREKIDLIIKSIDNF
jgi:hypothetical protein